MVWVHDREVTARHEQLFHDDLRVGRFRTSFVMQTAKESTVIEPDPALRG